MERPLRIRPAKAVIAGLLAVGLMHAATAQADVVLSDNITGVITGGTEAATDSNWLAASFTTGSSTAQLDGVTLLLANPTAGAVEVDIYDDGGLQPGSLVGTLTSPSSYLGPLVESTFTASGITLAADSTYWVVVHATGGEFDWAWASDDSFAGSGFTDTWAQSFDSGGSWFTYAPITTPAVTLGTDPLQMIVTAAAVPEPGSLASLGLGAGLLLYWRARGRRVIP
jgi:hypothetical protein